MLIRRIDEVGAHLWVSSPMNEPNMKSFLRSSPQSDIFIRIYVRMFRGSILLTPETRGEAHQVSTGYELPCIYEPLVGG